VQGQKVTLAIRPEKLSLAKTALQESDLRGEVQEIIYIGTDIRYLVRITPQTRIIVREQNRGGALGERFQYGEQVFIHWSTEHINLLTE